MQLGQYTGLITRRSEVQILPPLTRGSMKIGVEIMKFHKHDMFCKKCLIHDGCFIGGGSWSPSYCPKCGGIETILYKNMWPWQRYKAKKRWLCSTGAVQSADNRQTIGSSPTRAKED